MIPAYALVLLKKLVNWIGSVVLVLSLIHI